MIRWVSYWLTLQPKVVNAADGMGSILLARATCQTSATMSELGPASYLLAPLSWLYALGWEAYELIYRLGIKKPKEPHRPVVCVGNLQVGGTGKSPFVLYIAGLLKEMGKEVVIGASGYGSPMAEAAQFAPEGELNPRIWGDEPAMIRWLAPDLPLIVGRRRVLAAELCHREAPNAVLLMDDGFQHLPIKKYLSIVLDPPSGNHFCIPAGPYREPRNGLKRADLLLPGKFKLTRSKLTFKSANGQLRTADSSEVSVLCALGNPETFIASLKDAGLTLGTTKLLRDHDSLGAGTLLDGFPPEKPIVVTTKDWVKLRLRTDLEGREIWIAHQTVSVEPEQEFKAWLKQRLDEIEA